MARVLPATEDQLDLAKLPKHVAIIMDGNRRWAKHRGMPAIEGHRRGMLALREVTRACSDFGIPILTVYGFSTENWRRDSTEISLLLDLCVYFAQNELVELSRNNVRVNVIGAYRALPQGPGDDTFNNGLGTRSQLWHAAIVLWRSHPITGIGAGNYETQLGRVGLIGVRTHANSWYLQSLAEGGLLMFSAVLATIYGLIVTLMQSRAMLTNAALAATAAVCAHQVFDDLIFFPKVGAMWFLILGVGAAALSGSNPKLTAPPAGSYRIETL